MSLTEKFRRRQEEDSEFAKNAEIGRMVKKQAEQKQYLAEKLANIQSDLSRQEVGNYLGEPTYGKVDFNGYRGVVKDETVDVDWDNYIDPNQLYYDQQKIYDMYNTPQPSHWTNDIIEGKAAQMTPDQLAIANDYAELDRRQAEMGQINYPEPVEHWSKR
jgi:hypothetical protein